jgi:hypothetical protein
MRAVSSAILIVGGLAGLGYVLKTVLPGSSVITLEWKAQQYYIPFNIAAFWACVAVGAIAGAIQMVRAMLRDVERLH